MKTYIDKLREHHKQFTTYQNLPRIEIAVETMSLIPLALLYIEELENRIKELETKNQILQERIQKLEKQKNWLAKKCENLFDDVENSFMPRHIPAKEWIKRAEQATKEN